MTVGRRYRPYPAYKPSGVDWLGDIPEHWRAERLKSVFKIVNGSTPKSSNPDYWDGDIVWITPDDLGKLHSDTIKDSERAISKKGYLSCGTTLVPGGSLVVSTRAPVGYVGIAGAELCTNQGCRSLRFMDTDDTKYYYYTISSAREELESFACGSTFRELSRAALGYVAIPRPSEAEQHAIAAFLDRETAKIDALVAKKERLIELLEERRTALISRAVTRGLDANVALKPSGVPWLGEIPADWRVLPLKRLVAVKITDGPHETPDILSDGIPFVSAEAIKDGRIDFNARRGYISEDQHITYCRKCYPRRDDVFLCKSGATTGKAAIVDTDDEFSVWSPLAQIRADSEKALPRFIFIAIQAGYVQDQIRQGWSAGTQPNIAMSEIEKLLVIVPSIREQRDILEVLDVAITNINALIAKVREGVEKLKEYRTALISAAVTGKIDVRGEVAKCE